ncbi:hypothetical protein QE152_g39829 [Popillia japonica]|uniref:Uncharacterized protein n=1 Tax=Popillia japonica TaxID=7064 RepID=A0AAW1HSQ8_POPJA
MIKVILIRIRTEIQLNTFVTSPFPAESRCWLDTCYVFFGAAKLGVALCTILTIVVVNVKDMGNMESYNSASMNNPRTIYLTNYSSRALSISRFHVITTVEENALYV